MYPPPSPSLPPEYDWFSGPTTPMTQFAVAWVVCLTFMFFFCLALLADFILDKLALPSFAIYPLALVSCVWFVAFLICLIVWIVLTNQSEYDWFSGPTTPKTQLAVAWVVCLTFSIVSCNSFLIYSFLVPDDKAVYKSKLGLCALIWFVAS